MEESALKSLPNWAVEIITSIHDCIIIFQGEAVKLHLIELFSGFLGGLFLLFIKEYVLKAHFLIESKKDSQFNPITKMRETSVETKAKYLRVKITNKGFILLRIPSKNCRVYLTGLNAVDENGNTFQKGIEWLPLSYSHMTDKTLNLPTGVPWSTPISESTL